MDLFIADLIWMILLFLSGFPFLFLVADKVRSDLRQKPRPAQTMRALWLNSLLYPFVFILFFVVVAKVSGITDEPSHRSKTGSYLGELFIAFVNLSTAMVPTLLAGFLYSVISTFLLIKKKPFRFAHAALVAILVCLACIGVGYLLRTPIFNWLLHQPVTSYEDDDHLSHT